MISSGKKMLLITVIAILVIFCAFIVYAFTSSLESIGRDHQFPYLSNIIFVDGGNSNDTIKLTAFNTLPQTLTIHECIVNNQSVKFSGDLALPGKSTGNITLTLASGALVGGEQYDIWMNPNDTNGVFMMYAHQRYVYYHMYHPNVEGPVEEAVMIELFPSYYNRYFSYDEMGATIQNTGDFPITITGGFVNGMAAINTTGHLTIDKDETAQVDMLFPPRSLLDQLLGDKPFQVRLVTASNQLIGYVEPYYYPEPNSINNSENPKAVIEKGEISDVKFNNNSFSDDRIVLSFRNTGDTPVTIGGCLFNGKAAEVLQSSTTVNAGVTQELSLRTRTLFHGSRYQIVLISLENNAFIISSMTP
jgi:hypothetical protein